jgi:hypothetical protein
MIAVLFVCLAIDFVGRVVVFSPAASRLNIQEATTLSDAVPQIDEPHLERYMSNIAGLIKAPIQVVSGSSADDLATQQPTTEPADGFWRVGDLSYKLIALVENAERFAVLYGLNNEAGDGELIELRLGDSIGGYTVSEVLAKELRLTSDNGDQITLTLFEPEELRD